VPKALDYEKLSWCHPLRRLAFFRTRAEKIQDGKFLKRAGLDPDVKSRWYRNPEFIRLSQLLSACDKLNLNLLETLWVLIGDCPECRAGNFDMQHKHASVGLAVYFERLEEIDKIQVQPRLIKGGSPE